MGLPPYLDDSRFPFIASLGQRNGSFQQEVNSQLLSPESKYTSHVSFEKKFFLIIFCRDIAPSLPILIAIRKQQRMEQQNKQQKEILLMIQYLIQLVTCFFK